MISLYYFEGYAPADAAFFLGLPESTFAAAYTMDGDGCAQESSQATEHGATEEYDPRMVALNWRCARYSRSGLHRKLETCSWTAGYSREMRHATLRDTGFGG